MEYNLERIVWLDHSSYSIASWRDLEAQRKLKPLKICSVGFVIKEKKNYLILVPHLSKSGNSLGEMCIIKSSIIERTKL